MATHIRDVVVVSVPVSDQERAKRFYVDELGFELKRDDTSAPGMRWISVAPKSGRVTLALVDWFPSMPAGSQRGLVLTSSDLEADHAMLAARGVKFEQPPRTRPWGKEAVFLDPDGNAFVLQQV